MGRLNNDEQFKFLISCIRYSNNGKVRRVASRRIAISWRLLLITTLQVDFGEVAKECDIVTKGAAYVPCYRLPSPWETKLTMA